MLLAITALAEDAIAAIAEIMWDNPKNRSRCQLGPSSALL